MSLSVSAPSGNRRFTTVSGPGERRIPTVTARRLMQMNDWLTLHPGLPSARRNPTHAACSKKHKVMKDRAQGVDYIFQIRKDTSANSGKQEIYMALKIEPQIFKNPRQLWIFY
jgi:hypothetical protein